jgi:hypothetical protein
MDRRSLSLSLFFFFLFNLVSNEDGERGLSLMILDSFYDFSPLCSFNYSKTPYVS